MKRLIRTPARGWKAIVMASAAFIVVHVVAFAAGGDQGVSEILIDRLLIRVVSDAKLAYQIEAGQGRMNEDTREIELFSPKVAIYGEAEQVKQSVHSQAGKMWPVKVTVTDAKGEEKEISKYDWSLSGDVAFESVEGYLVKSPELNFRSSERNITSFRGVEYRMPTGRGTILSGKAKEFEARVNPDTGALTGWTLGGGVELFADSENPSSKDETAEDKSGKDGKEDGKKSGKKKKRTLEGLMEEQTDKLKKKIKKD